jgi:tetratricopeptide (TPR) repeat protein
MKGIFYHNAMDIVALAAMFGLTASMLHDPFDESIQHGLDVIALAKLYEDLDQWEVASRLYERGLEMDLGEENFWKAVHRLSVLQKKRGDLESAVGLWEQAAAQGHVYAHVELAKHYEHRKKEYLEAQKWSQAALDIVNIESDMPGYVRDHWQTELEHRLNRLKGKINNHPERRE